MPLSDYRKIINRFLADSISFLSAFGRGNSICMCMRLSPNTMELVETIVMPSRSRRIGGNMMVML